MTRGIGPKCISIAGICQLDMDEEQQSNRYLEFIVNTTFQVGVLIGILTIVVLLFWVITGRLGYPFSTRVDLSGIFVSAILTLVLIAVYGDIAKRERIQSQEVGRQADILAEQVQIHEEQVDLQEQQIKLQEIQTDLQSTVIELQEAQQKYMEANHKPVLQILDWEVIDTRDRLKIELQNKGNGLAQDIKIKPGLSISADSPTREFYIGVEEYINGAHSPGGLNPLASPAVTANGNLKGESGAVLQAGEGEELHSDIQFFRNKFDHQEEDFVVVEEMQFSDVLQQVNQVESLLVSLELHYKNVLGEVETKEIYSETIEPDGAEFLEEMI